MRHAFLRVTNRLVHMSPHLSICVLALAQAVATPINMQGYIKRALYMQLREEAAHLELQKIRKQQAAEPIQFASQSENAAQTTPYESPSHAASASMTELTAEALDALEKRLADALAAADAAQEARGASDEACAGLKRETAHLYACLATAQRDAADARASAASAGTYNSSISALYHLLLSFQAHYSATPVFVLSTTLCLHCE